MDVGDNAVNEERDSISPEEPQSLDVRTVKFGTALGHKSNNNKNKQYLSGLWEEYEKHFGTNGKRVFEKRAPFRFGTALGHKSKENKEDKYLNDLWETYNSLFPEGAKNKRGIKFGTALGHDTGNGNQNDYNKAAKDKFNELFGKRNGLKKDEKNDSWYQLRSIP